MQATMQTGNRPFDVVFAKEDGLLTRYMVPRIFSGGGNAKSAEAIPMGISSNPGPLAGPARFAVFHARKLNENRINAKAQRKTP